MRVLVYKRTHNGDPDADGCFGAYDCMGIVRDREFDAVVGVGGIGPEAQANGIDGQVNWIGIGPHKRYVEDKRGPEILFDHFLYFGTDGPDFRTLAPQLAARMYGDNVRSLIDGMSDAEQEEAEGIVRLAEDEPPSPGLRSNAASARPAEACRSGGRNTSSVPEERMADESHDTGPRVFWCNTNRGAGSGGNSLEQQMHARRFAAAWTSLDHPDETFNYPDHMRRVRRGDTIFIYANSRGVIGVGRATESRLELLFPDHPDRLRAFGTEGENEEEWRIPVEWLVWDEANPCVVEWLRSSFQEITDHAERVRAVRQHFRL